MTTALTTEDTVTTEMITTDIVTTKMVTISLPPSSDGSDMAEITSCNQVVCTDPRSTCSLKTVTMIGSNNVAQQTKAQCICQDPWGYDENTKRCDKCFALRPYQFQCDG